MTLWQVLTLLPYVAATAACVVLGVRRHRAIAEKERRAAEWAAMPRTGAGIVFRPFSVFLNGCKLSMATGHDLTFGQKGTSLTVRQLVSGSAAYPERDACARLLRDSFVASSIVTVEIGPIDGDSIALGEMGVANLDYTTDFKTGVTKLVAELTGPSIVKPATKLDQAALEQTFAAIEARAERTGAAVGRPS